MPLSSRSVPVGPQGRTCNLSRTEIRKHLFSLPRPAALSGRRVAVGPPAVAAAKGGENPSAGAARTSPSAAAAPGASPLGRPGPHRNLPERQAGAECLPGSARQCPGRAASSRSPSSSGGASRGAAVRGPRARPEPLTPGQHATPAPTAPSPRAPGRPLRSLAAGPAALGPWGFASCRAMGTLHTSRPPPPRSAPRPGAQPSVPRCSPGISGHGPGAGGRERRAAPLARSSCRAGAGSGRRLHPRRGRGRMEPRGERAGVPTVRSPRAGQGGWDGRRPGGPFPGSSYWLRGRGLEERGLAAAGALGDPPAHRPLRPLRPALLALWLVRTRVGLWLPGGQRYCSSERRFIDKESTSPPDPARQARPARARIPARNHGASPALARPAGRGRGRGPWGRKGSGEWASLPLFSLPAPHLEEKRWAGEDFRS